MQRFLEEPVIDSWGPIVVPEISIRAFRKLAKRIAKASDVSHSQVLNGIARELSFRHWSDLLEKSSPRPETVARFSDSLVVAMDGRECDLDTAVDGAFVYDPDLSMACANDLAVATQRADRDDPGTHGFVFGFSDYLSTFHFFRLKIPEKSVTAAKIGRLCADRWFFGPHGVWMHGEWVLE